MTNEKDNMPLVGRRPKYRNHVRWAIYRIHYGLDFLSQSIESIRDDVDKIFALEVQTTPFGSHSKDKYFK